jgi:hypothetical protein
MRPNRSVRTAQFDRNHRVWRDTFVGAKIKPHKPGSLWTFVNSSFGVFLLSSVFLGSLSFFYGQWRDYSSREKRAEQLQLEIALRLQAIQLMASGTDKNRYSNLVNIAKVIDGDTKSSFYVRKPLFNEFDNKTLSSLLWQLYLVIPSRSQSEIKGVIRDVDAITREIREVRYQVANEPETSRAKPQTKEEQDKQDDEEDHLKKDYGQGDIFKRITNLSQQPRWKGRVE